MKIIHTADRTPESLDPMEKEWAYNGLDCCITAEVLSVLLPQLDNHTAATYNFSRELQAPVLEMRLRGLLVDSARKAEVIDEFYERIDQLEDQLNRIVFEGVGMLGFNWRSNADLQALFYGKLHIQPILKGGRPTVDRNALEKMENYLIAKVIIRHLLLMRDLGKKIGVLKTEVDPDGRMRTSYNIAGTSTGRFSSSFSEFGTGGNLQNVEESLRSIFISDPRYKFAKFDAKQIQSRVFGAMEWNALGDATYLDACESSDLHTLVAKMVWPKLAWTGDPGADKDIAETKFYRWYSHRDLCKKLGHGTNFGGLPPTLSAQTGVPLQLVMDFQPKYYSAFPAHTAMHAWIENQIRRTGTLVSIDGRKRQFWGRRNSPDTIREAIAYGPQATEAYIVNNGLLNIWRARDAIVMMQDHDAVVAMYPEEREAEVIPKLLEQLRFPLMLDRGRELLVPYDCQVGWNRGKYDPKKNPDGLKDYFGSDARKRTPPVHFLDRKGYK